MGTLNVSNVNATGNLNLGGSWTDAPPGTIIQIAFAESGPARQAIASATPQTITGLSISFTPRIASSKIIISAMIVSSETFVTSLGVFQDGSPTCSTTGETNLNQNNMDITMYDDVNQTNLMYSTPLQTMLSATNTNTRTYDIRAVSQWDGQGPYTLYINNRAQNDMASFSRMFIYEVAQ